MAISVICSSSRFDVCDLKESQFLQRFAATVYQCPHCATMLSFCTNDFSRHLGSSFTNLPEKLAAAMDQAMKDKGLDNLSFLDFLCPSCKLAARVCYEGEWLCGAKWDAFGYRLHIVLECDDAEQSVASEPAQPGLLF